MGDFVDICARILRAEKVEEEEILRAYESVSEQLRPATALFVARRAMEGLVPADLEAVRILVRMGKTVGDSDLDQAISHTLAPAVDIFATLALRLFGHKHITLSADVFGSLLVAALGPGLPRIRVLRPASTMVCAHPYSTSDTHAAVLEGFKRDRSDLSNPNAPMTTWLDVADRAIQYLPPPDVLLVRDLAQHGDDVEDDVDDAIFKAVSDATDLFAEDALARFKDRRLCIAADAFAALVTAALGPSTKPLRALRAVSSIVRGHPYADDELAGMVVSGLSQAYLYVDD